MKTKLGHSLGFGFLVASITLGLSSGAQTRAPVAPVAPVAPIAPVAPVAPVTPIAPVLPVAPAITSPPPIPFATANLTPLGARALAANCAACHGTNGNSVGGAIPGLAGINKEYFVNQLKAFKEGKREATVMQQIAKGYSDAEIAAIADFFAAQKK